MIKKKKGNTLEKNFVEIIKLFNREKINYWLCHGTLLGLIRDKQLIPWDHDIDIAVWSHENLRQKILKLFKKRGYIRKKKFFKDDNLLTFINTKTRGREVDINFYEKSELQNLAFQRHYDFRNIIMRFINVVSISRNYKGNYKIIVNKLVFFESIFRVLKKILIKTGIFYVQKGYMTPIYLFERFKFINISGLYVRVPFYYKKYLKHIYGTSWKMPIKNYKWTKDSPSSSRIN